MRIKVCFLPVRYTGCPQKNCAQIAGDFDLVVFIQAWHFLLCCKEHLFLRICWKNESNRIKIARDTAIFVFLNKISWSDFTLLILKSRYAHKSHSGEWNGYTCKKWDIWPELYPIVFIFSGYNEEKMIFSDGNIKLCMGERIKVKLIPNLLF